MALMRLLLLAVMAGGQWSMVNGQITIDGNVYGGGNEGNVKGNATVTVYAGDLNNVFGGARVANVGGRTFVNVDGKHASDDILIKAVYGGNDISGTIGKSEDVVTTVPEELENTTTDPNNTVRTKNYIDTSWKTFVRTSANDYTKHAMVIGRLFGGGNGDYEYVEPVLSSGKIYYDIYSLPRKDNDNPILSKVTDEDDTSFTGFKLPELPKTYLELKGGCIAHVYGGGNNATVTEETVINIDNESAELQTQAAAFASRNSESITDVLSYLQTKVSLTTFQSNLTSYAFNFARVFGGNNKATMNIMPTWNLQKGIIRDLYSGGNEGNMTNPIGLLLDIDPVDKTALTINNVYGGCRRADVYPLQADGTPSLSEQIQLPNTMLDNYGNGYRFPSGLPARTLVRGGIITNVYGGNDISGRVFGGNAIGIYSSILGDVYGGGNGSYAYTDNSTLGAMDEYKDFYYNIAEVKEKEKLYNKDFDDTQTLTSVDALNIFRPNAEQVSLRLWGESATNPTIIGGSVFVGGNSATLRPKLNLSEGEEPLVELKIGSHVYADKVFLGNNGENMVNPSNKGILSLFAGNITVDNSDYDFSQIDLTNPNQFATYMDGCAMTVRPKVVFDLKINDTTGDPDSYIDYTSYFGSFYCGGNVGSMKYTGSNTIDFTHKVIIFDKLVGGSNNAYVPLHDNLNAAYEGGVLLTPDDNGNKIILNLSNLKLQPKRWVDEADKSLGLVWNTWMNGEQVEVPSGGFTDDDLKRRLVGGNVYGGCCESGHVEGNVVININGTIVDHEGEYGVFDSATPIKTDLDPDPDPDILYGHNAYDISERRSGVILGEQGMDVLGEALTVYGGGKGKDTEIWGSATVNINRGYCFQVFGGSESGVIGKPTEGGTYGFNNKHYTYNPAYSTYVNLNCERAGASRTDDPSEEMADVEFIYGGSFEGPIIGNTNVHLDNGRLFNLFAGSCNADILGHTETYVGLNGFPYLRDHIYGGNDLGGEIKSLVDFSEKVRDYNHDKSMMHGYNPANASASLDVLQANSYVEYQQGSMKSIFGGCFGDYDYHKEFKAPNYSIPYLRNAFVNIRPVSNTKNQIEKVFGAGEGCPGIREGDKMQDRSYVLIDIDDSFNEFKTTEVFGSGSYNGLGMKFTKDETITEGFDLDQASAIIDLLRGKIGNVFGGSHNEGVTRRTVVNVPEESTIWLYSEEPDQDEEQDGTKTKHQKEFGNIFGGAYGTQILPPCDVYESNVNYRSDKAIVNGSIFGGNNKVRRTLYTNVNIYTPVWSHKDKEAKGYLSTVYGAGQGKETWSEHTEVNLWDGAQVYEVYGGGMMGHVLNAESVQKYMQLYQNGPSNEIASKDPVWSDSNKWTIDDQGNRTAKDLAAWQHDWADAWTLGDYYAPDVDSDNDGVADSYDFTQYVYNAATTLSRISDRSELESDTKAASQLPGMKYNANVIINEGAYVANYAYGGGYGKKKEPLSGDVYGTTYIALLGGTVQKDIYAAGTSGSIHDLFGVGALSSSNPTGFTASSNAFIKGGTCRNVYGGGWEGNVGAHTGSISDLPNNDIPGETNVVIGSQSVSYFTEGIPAIQRNAYGGGEGGAVYGTANLTLNNGYIGYQFDPTMEDDSETTDISEQYVEKIEDDTYKKDNVLIPNERLKRAGCIFGGGYVDNSSVDKTHVTLYGGHVRNSVFGGGEIAAVGRGTISKTTTGGKTSYTLSGLHRPGKTMVEMFGGHVHHNVFGGGRGYDNLNNHGSLNCDGYVFGQTEVHIHGGEIGTKAELSDSVGNVFGGGDVGYVYSAYENTDGTFGRGVKPAGSERYKDEYQGYYFKHQWEGDTSTGNNIDADGFYTENVTVGEGESATTTTERMLTEDCKVLIEPQCKVLTAVNINGHDYSAGDYVDIDALNTLKNKDADAKWGNLDATGIIIHNAVFAGGNTSTTSTASSAGINTPSVFGNATASIHDVYHRDLITLGTGHTGGLYGDGNLTLVDGYRELNITNYGTDFYSIPKEINNTTYHSLPERERAYYELKYTCDKDCTDKDGTKYKKATTDANGFTTKASTLTADELQNLFLIFDETTNKYTSVLDGTTPIMEYSETDHEWKPSTTYWKESGVLPVYAGRLMNSIQRADFCGVWGSRMVMQGARDRVPKEPDYTNYTINRVREVSLNKVDSPAGDTDDTNKMHGNYFGIYNIVNYLGALTSDVDFGDDNTRTDKRSTDNTDASTYKCEANGQAYGEASFYDWKKAFHSERKRNNGNSHNKVALASGVYLELTTEESTGTGLFEKVWGPITGVVELDLINVSTGIGGGFVYAKNVHGVRSATGHKNTTLTALNNDAVTKWDFDYDATTDASKEEWQTSGNFVHSTQTIIDDCYNISNRYKGTEGPDGAMPAHYWYIKGSVYVYPQLISAHTGMPNAYSETVDIPLTISAASHGTLKLLDVRPNLYAFYSSPGVPLENGKKVVINDKEYYKNDPISYWDWYLLSNSEKGLFVEDTYVNCVACTIDGTAYAAGEYIMTASQFNTFKGSSHTYKDADGNDVLDGDNNVATTTYIFRPSNDISHDTGYILTYNVTNPENWDTWYTPKTGSSQSNKIDTKGYEGKSTEEKKSYEDGPTYRLKATTGEEVLGQSPYKVGELISQDVETNYPYATGNKPDGQADFEKAYIVTKEQTISVTVNNTTTERHLYPGVAVSETDKAKLAADSYDEAYICTRTIKLSDTEFIYKDSKMTKAEWTTYYNRYNGGTEAQQKIADEIYANVVPAYYCTKEGLYGGRNYQSGRNYRGLEAWSSMSQSDRDKFDFNYDALDLLIDPTYGKQTDGTQQPQGQKYQYDGKDFTTETQAKGNKAGYSVTQSVDYTASYNGTGSLTLSEEITVKRLNEATGKIEPTQTNEIKKDDELSRDDFEALPNEKRHYAPIVAKEAGTYYVVKTPFQIGSTPYAIGNTISKSTYDGLPDTEQGYIDELTFDEYGEDVVYYYCREPYDNVAIGDIISQSQYASLPNDQKDFVIHGISPTETSTLFVSRESDINNLSKDKIITVIYQYDYEETDASGNITPVSERHVLNIQIQFKSGVPIIEDIEAPNIILPGQFVSLAEPHVIFDTNALLEPGWELYETERDAQSHTNAVKFDGQDFNPLNNPLYWYQNDWYVAYYISTMESGRNYSNYVPVSVANYHDLKKVMTDKDHHYYIDQPNVLRDPKIYINNYSADTEGSKNGLDLFKDLYDLSLVKGTEDGYTFTNGKITTVPEGANTNVKDHSLLDSQVRAGRNLEFFLRTDIDRPSTAENPWIPIGYDGISDDPATTGTDEGLTGQCFDGVLHGDGHTISGLNNSLFDHLCGEVYNLGVMGSFTGGGIANTGDGYVESCWVKTSATSGIPAGTKAVFGNPTASTGHKQVVNCYYPESNNGYTTGDAIMKPDRAFYNGEVAYDLNNFYLYKRYNDNAKPTGTTTYKYWKAGETEPVTGTYAQNENLCSSGYNGLKYVENRFADGDFIYAKGELPDPNSQDVRYHLETITETVDEAQVTKTETHYYPIWPDDYLFFGQKLTYGHTDEAHQDVPTAIKKTDGWLSQLADANRVYRAPAYYRSSTMSVAHFNPNAVFAQTKKDDATTIAYKNMTAIDFTGYNDTHEPNGANKPYLKGTNDGKFYPPLLDDDGLTGFLNVDLTKNLLVYTAVTGENTTAAEKTANVVGDYLSEPVYTESNEGYRRVAGQPTSDIHGHWVEDGTATRDHLLVDENDFYAPISYTFASDKRMWHQRTPTNYAGQKTVIVDGKEKTVPDRNAGWEAISLPFSAELVTTDQKGEITHFFSGSESSKNGTDTKIGHEYWLRKLVNGSTLTPKPTNETGNDQTSIVLTANFTYPSTTDGSALFSKAKDDKVTNTFLWDYYYQGVTGGHDQKDMNGDKYLKYYSDSRTYDPYAMLTNGIPYLIGLPGITYYEFDLSGKWEALTTGNTKPAILRKQVITFASVPGTTIQASDSEMGGSTATYDNKSYIFKPNYLNTPELETGKHAFLLNSDGDRYLEDKTSTTANVNAFRPYFMATASTGSREITRSIVFSGDGADMPHEASKADDPSTLSVHAAKHKIVVTSTLKYTTDVRIVNTAGQVLDKFAIKPGETIETRIQNAGVFIVQDEEGKYIKKLAVE